MKEMKNVISKSFKAFKCIDLCLPSGDSKILQNNLFLQKNELNPEFLRQIKTVQTFLNTSMEPIMYCNRPVTGPIFITLLTKAVEAINKGELPSMRDPYSAVVEYFSCKDGLLKVNDILQKINSVQHHLESYPTPRQVLFCFLKHVKHFLVSTYNQICYAKDHSLAKEHLKQITQTHAEFEKKVFLINRQSLIKKFDSILNGLFTQQQQQPERESFMQINLCNANKK